MARIILSDLDTQVLEKHDDIRLLYDFSCDVLRKGFATSRSLPAWRSFAAHGLRLWRQRQGSSVYQGYNPNIGYRFGSVSGETSSVSHEEWERAWFDWLRLGSELAINYPEAARSPLISRVACKLAREYLDDTSIPSWVRLESLNEALATLGLLHPPSDLRFTIEALRQDIMAVLLTMK